MEMNNWTFALALSLLAGLSTGLGGLFALLFNRTNTRYLSVALGFSAGIMIFISLYEILPESRQRLTEAMGHTRGGLVVMAAFALGILLIGAIDRLIPEWENPHEPHSIEELRSCNVSDQPHRLMKTSVMMALAITIHNFPEGLATFVTAMAEPKLGIAIAAAIAIHNIPEGIAVSIPAYCATGSKKKALVYSLLSGAAEPLGAVFAFLFLAPFIDALALGVIFAGVAGIMTYISFDELLPTARHYGQYHLALYGLLAGMLVMGLSLLLLF